MNALEELIVLAFILNVLIGCFLYYAVLVKGFNNRTNAMLLVLAFVLAVVTGLLGAPIMTLFMGPFLCLGAVLLYFALRSLLAENSPSNYLKSLKQKPFRCKTFLPLRGFAFWVSAELLPCCSCRFTLLTNNPYGTRKNHTHSVY